MLHQKLEIFDRKLSVQGVAAFAEFEVINKSQRRFCCDQFWTLDGVESLRSICVFLAKCRDIV